MDLSNLHDVSIPRSPQRESGIKPNARASTISSTSGSTGGSSSSSSNSGDWKVGDRGDRDSDERDLDGGGRSIASANNQDRRVTAAKVGRSASRRHSSSSSSSSSSNSGDWKVGDRGDRDSDERDLDGGGRSIASANNQDRRVTAAKVGRSASRRHSSSSSSSSSGSSSGGESGNKNNHSIANDADSQPRSKTFRRREQSGENNNLKAGSSDKSTASKRVRQDRSRTFRRRWRGHKNERGIVARVGSSSSSRTVLVNRQKQMVSAQAEKRRRIRQKNNPRIEKWQGGRSRPKTVRKRIPQIKDFVAWNGSTALTEREVERAAVNEGYHCRLYSFENAFCTSCVLNLALEERCYPWRANDDACRCTTYWEGGRPLPCPFWHCMPLLSKLTDEVETEQKPFPLFALFSLGAAFLTGPYCLLLFFALGKKLSPQIPQRL